MENKFKSEGSMLAFSNYKPKPGQEDALMELVKKHLPVLRELGLATEAPSFIARSSDGRIVEVFEWASGKAVSAAHQHPAVSEIWEKMTLVADFLPFNSLPEGNAPFLSLEIVK